ncbi:hypothetical protein B0H14DRAFT_2561377 [Mycena olivaceomarginata]|nr:hypothetical protein B0H14DRAFT_2561377 [Mycena olivaceomarginata]
MVHQIFKVCLLNYIRPTVHATLNLRGRWGAPPTFRTKTRSFLDYAIAREKARTRRATWRRRRARHDIYMSMGAWNRSASASSRKIRRSHRPPSTAFVFPEKNLVYVQFRRKLCNDFAECGLVDWKVEAFAARGSAGVTPSVVFAKDSRLLGRRCVNVSLKEKRLQTKFKIVEGKLIVFST